MNDLRASPNSLTNTQGLKKTPPPPKNEIVNFFIKYGIMVVPHFLFD